MNNILTYCLDTASIDDIKRARELYPLHAFSMNPSIASRDLQGKNVSFFSVLKEIRSVIGEDAEFSVQTVGDTADEIVRDAAAIRAHVTGTNLFVKVNAFSEGYKAMRMLKAQGYNVTATAIASVNQALVSIEAGADTVAVYVGRVDNISGDGIQVLRDIHGIMADKGITGVQLAGASIRTARQVEQAALAGAHIVAVGLGVLEACANHPLTDQCVAQFIADWEALYGAGKRVYNLE
jgi:TalC/MipB family fructose-6-phosphate aldolase